MPEGLPKPGEARNATADAIIATLRESPVGTRAKVEATTLTGEVISVTVVRTKYGIESVKD